MSLKNERHKEPNGKLQAPSGILLITACSYTQAGLVSLAVSRGAIIDLLEQPADLVNIVQTKYSRVVCDMCGDLAGCLSRVALLGLALSQGIPGVVITPGPPPPWLYCTLRCLAGKMANLSVMQKSVSLDDMIVLATGEAPKGIPTLLEALPEHTPGLSRRELEVMQALLCGESVKIMASRTGLKEVTLHAHRQHGIYKLGMRRRKNSLEASVLK